MKNALFELIKALRDVDKITFMTYADTVKVLEEGMRGNEKEKLNTLVEGVKAKGMTKGNKAILKAQEVAQKHYIEAANNQIFLVTDGKFSFYEKDKAKWLSKQHDKKVVLSVIAFGKDKEAIKNLKEISKLGEGSFIQVKTRKDCHEQLMDEVRKRSRR